MSMQPGWYPDPFSSGGYVRWWDGQRWGPSQAASAATADQPATGTATQPPPPVPAAPWGDHPGGQPGAQPPAYGGPAYGAPVGQQVATFPLATWGQRAAAKIIDIIIETALLLPFTVWLLWPAIRDFSDALPADGSLPSDEVLLAFQNEVVGLSLTLTLVSTAITFLYEVPQNVRWGRTIGMRVLGIRIRPLAADVPLTWGQATIRWGAYAAGALVAGFLWTLVDYLWPLWDKPWRQALHDKAAKTVVVPTR